MRVFGGLGVWEFGGQIFRFWVWVLGVLVCVMTFRKITGGGSKMAKISGGVKKIKILGLLLFGQKSASNSR